MPKGDQTRQAILEQAAQVFNLKGYAGASLDDLMQATKLTKGGIYNHFGSKEALALAAFDFAMERVYARFRDILYSQPRNTRNRLLAVVESFTQMIDDPVLQGGCPILNTAVEADDTNPPLRDRARQAASDWQDFIIRTLEYGIAHGDTRPEVNPEDVANILIAALEGGVMLSKLYGDSQYIHRTADHLTQYIESLLL